MAGLGAPASGELLAPSNPGLRPPSLLVSDELDRRGDLLGPASKEPTLLLPIFARCAGICPMTAHVLKDALAAGRPPFRVVVLSFDPEDTARSLKEFRAQGLPADWRMVRSPDGAAARAFFDSLDFHYMKTAGGFDHPNATFVLSPRGRWAGTFSGSSFPEKELERAYRRALAADDPSLAGRLPPRLNRPEAWILLAGAGLCLSIAVIVLAVLRSRRRRAGNH